MISVHYAAYVRINAYDIYGDRFVGVRSIERIAERVTNDLRDADLTITESNVAHTPQFGQYHSRLTIIGIDNVDSSNFQPASPVCVDAPYTSTNDNYRGIPGKVVAGYRATQERSPKGQIISEQTRTNMLNLKSTLEAASPDYLNPGGRSNIYQLYYMGIIFGDGGYSFQ